MFSDLARRGLQHPNTVAFVKRAVMAQDPQGSGQLDKPEVPIWGAVLLSASFWVAMVAVYLVTYMLQEVVATLCMVESPVAAITVSPSAAEPGDSEEKEGLLEAGPTITLVHQKPITSTIRGTIRHLVENAGRGARFRGVKIYFCYAVVFASVASFLSALLPRFSCQPVVVAGLTGALLSNLHATWTHKVVSMPNTKPFCQRFRAASHFKTLAFPAAVEAATPYISLYLTCGVAMLLGVHKLHQENLSAYTNDQLASVALRVLFVLVFLVSCTLFLCLPAVVTLVRIEASLLPLDHDTIVPFDRSFGGRVAPALAEKIGFLDAWRTFNWEARRRLIVLFLKNMVLIAGLMLVVAHVLLAEVLLVMGPAAGRVLSQAKANGWVQ